MCTREELNSLIRELLRHIEQVALLGAKIQFDEESKLNKPAEYLTCSDHTKNYVRNNAENARFKQVARFHMAYLKYFVFASDPYAEIIVPLSSSSLSLFITNIMSKMASSPQQIPFRHTSKTIIEFLQVRPRAPLLSWPHTKTANYTNFPAKFSLFSADHQCHTRALLLLTVPTWFAEYHEGNAFTVRHWNSDENPSRSVSQESRHATSRCTDASTDHSAHGQK